jgi:hypothetical protein
MTIATKVAALLEAVSSADIAGMTPVERRRFADRCRHLADLAEPKPDAPKAGVLADLRNGRRPD